MQNVAILGSTGSVGESTLAVIRANPDKFRAYALVANQNISKIYNQCIEFKPALVCLVSRRAAVELRGMLKAKLPDCEVVAGLDSVEQIVASDGVDSVMAAIVGSQGLRSTVAAAKAGKKIMLANKESLVMSGDLLLDIVKKNKGKIIPTDSEHNAIFQVLPQGYNRVPRDHGLKKIVLTASGGPFLNMDKSTLKNVTPVEACKHPTWNMGKKISVDSATLMNKGLEIIEAYHLFNVNPDSIEVLIHPQSLVHSLVEYIDGSVLAQMGVPDMTIPIAHALGFPERVGHRVDSLNLSDVGALSFFEPDRSRFRCLDMAYRALAEGGSSSIYLNAANEVAVEAFLNQALTFTAIPDVVEKVLDKLPNQHIRSLDDVLEADRSARLLASRCCAR